MDSENLEVKQKHYFTGRPCKRGHVAKRIVSSRACVECAKANDLKSRAKRLNYFIDYQKRNPEKTKAAQERYRENNRDLMRERDRKRKQNPETKQKRAAYERARRQNKRAGGGEIKKKDIDFLYESQNKKCASCNRKLESFHVDHITPIYLGGSSEIHNLQILCPLCNLKKGKLDPLEWAKLNGKLF